MLSISVDKLTSLHKDMRSHESSHPLRFYTLEIGRTGIELRIVDRSTTHTYSVIEIFQYDALALCDGRYTAYVFDKAEAKIEHGLASLSQFGGREEV